MARTTKKNAPALEAFGKFTDKINTKKGRHLYTGIMQTGGYQFVTDGCIVFALTNDAPDQPRPFDNGNAPDLTLFTSQRKNAKTFITFDTPDLAQAVKGASVFARESTDAVYLKSDGPDLYIVASSVEYGDSCRKLACTWKGNEIEIALDWKYLDKICKFFAHLPQITLEIQREGAPAFIADADRLVILMPMRVELDAAPIIEASKAPFPEPRPYSEIKDSVWLPAPRGSEHYDMETIHTAERWPMYEYNPDYTAKPVRRVVTDVPKSEPAPGAIEIIINKLDVYTVQLDEERVQPEICLTV
jgi:hypothetical protein